MTKSIVSIGRKAKHLKRKRLSQQRKLPVIAVDCSGSMGYTPVGSSEAKIDAARRALHLATSKYPSVRIIGFSGRGVDSFSRDTLYRMMAAGGTPFLKALQFAHQLSPLRLILISDGQPTDSSTYDIEQWVHSFVSFPIDTVATDGADDAFLMALADLTGGEFKRIDDLSGMLEQHVTYLIEEKE